MDDFPEPHERGDLILREAEGATPTPADLLREIAQGVHKLFPDVHAAARWGLLRGKRKDDAEIARLMADVIEKLGNLDLERQRLVDERDAAVRKADQSSMELETKRIEAKAEAVKKLLDAYANAVEKGVVFDAKVMKMVGLKLVEAMSFDA